MCDDFAAREEKAFKTPRTQRRRDAEEKKNHGVEELRNGNRNCSKSEVPPWRDPGCQQTSLSDGDDPVSTGTG